MRSIRGAVTAPRQLLAHSNHRRVRCAGAPRYCYLRRAPARAGHQHAPAHPGPGPTGACALLASSAGELTSRWEGPGLAPPAHPVGGSWTGACTCARVRACADMCGWVSTRDYALKVRVSVTLCELECVGVRRCA